MVKISLVIHVVYAPQDVLMVNFNWIITRFALKDVRVQMDTFWTIIWIAFRLKNAMVFFYKKSLKRQHLLMNCFTFLGVPKCPPNKEYISCGPSCTSLCDNGVLLLFKCIACCTPGCFCKPGFIRNEKDECIKECKPNS